MCALLFCMISLIIASLSTSQDINIKSSKLNLEQSNKRPSQLSIFILSGCEQNNEIFDVEPCNTGFHLDGKSCVPDVIDDNDDSTTNELLGERSIVTPVVRGSAVDFNTLIPDRDPCSAGGDGWVMRVNPYTGGSLQVDPVIDANMDGHVNEGDRVDFSTTVGTGNPAGGGTTTDTQRVF